MSYIYKITNIKNSKIYIGKTLYSIQQRWSEHCRDYKKEKCENRPLYKAMKKYGINNFIVSEIEECSENVLSDRERYWIEFYSSFKNGYNATIGGDGVPYIDYDIVVETYLQTKNQKKTAKLLGVTTKTIRNILRIRNIHIIPMTEVNNKKFGVLINMFSLSNDYLKSFSSAHDAARYILKDKDKTYISGVATHILDVCKGKRKTAYNFKWRYA